MVKGKSDRAAVRVYGANITQSLNEYQQTKWVMKSKPGRKIDARLHYADTIKNKQPKSASLISKQIIH